MTKKLTHISETSLVWIRNTLIYNVLRVIGGGKFCNLTLCNRTSFHIGVLCLLGLAPLFVSCGKDIPSDATDHTRAPETTEESTDSTGSTLTITVNDQWEGDTTIHY